MKASRIFPPFAVILAAWISQFASAAPPNDGNFASLFSARIRMIPNTKRAARWRSGRSWGIT
jgi:hypothetical protein